MLDFILVYALIPFLGDEDFATRNQTQNVISAMLPAGLPFVQDCAAGHQDVEIQRRCQALIRSYIPRLTASLLPKDAQRFPWIDSSPDWHLYWSNGEPSSQHKYLEMARSYMGHGNWANQYPEYSEATKLMIMDKLYNGESEKDIRALLAKMCEGDKIQIERHQIVARGRIWP